VTLLIMVMAGMTAVAGCGRKGDLDTPSAVAARAAGEKAPEGEIVKDRKFVLDGLIE
jgi:predicted small lipoprotein YifL